MSNNKIILHDGVELPNGISKEEYNQFIDMVLDEWYEREFIRIKSPAQQKYMEEYLEKKREEWKIK